MDRPDPRFDLLRFGLEADLRQSRPGRLLRAFRREPGSVLRALFWWLCGARLRARMRLRAVVGDRLRFRSSGASWPAPFVSAAPAGEGVRVERIEGGPGWIDRINAALRVSDADILCIAAPGCRWLEASIPEISVFFAQNEGLWAVYSDALIEGQPGSPHWPLVPPAFDEDAFLALPPIAPAIAIRRERLLQLGGIATAKPGAEIADLLFRVLRVAGADAIGHIQSCCVHWAAGASAARLPEGEARILLEARLATVKEHLTETGRAAECCLDPAGAVEISHALPRPAPLVSIIVPTRDRVDLLRQCLAGVLEATTYPELEVIVVDNDSIEPETHRYFEALASEPRLRILRVSGAFNFPRLNNIAVEAARGSVLALVNNDVSVIAADWLAKLVAQALRPEIGAVGPKLLYPSGLVQHGGVILARKGLPRHGHQFFPADHRGYLHRLAVTHQVGAVTAACLVVEKRKYLEAGGMDETAFPVAFNDVDLCLALDAKGYRNLFVPGVTLHHHESASRASDRSAGQLRRWQGEVAAFQKKWPQWTAFDPHCHPLLGDEMADFSLPHLQ